MQRLKLNPEYARRHLFVTLLMVALGCWFGYDGFIGYPATPAAELYKSIEGSDAPEGHAVRVHDPRVLCGRRRRFAAREIKALQVRLYG